MRRFSNAASKKLGDTTVDRQHLTFCVQAALTGDQPGVLEFSSHSPGCASLPLELLEALNSAANLQNSPVRTVILPPGLTEMPQWLKVLPIKRLVVPEFARKSLDLGGQLPPGAQIQVVAPLDEKIEVTGFDPDMTQLEILPKTSVLMDVQNKV
jgi:hypothetical protein